MVTVFPIVPECGREIVWVRRGGATCCGHCTVFDTMEESSSDQIGFVHDVQPVVDPGALSKGAFGVHRSIGTGMLLLLDV